MRATLTFYSLADTSQVRHLRTTSRLERFNRTLRARLRPACALHSDQGLTCMIAQQVSQFNSVYVATT